MRVFANRSRNRRYEYVQAFGYVLVVFMVRLASLVFVLVTHVVLFILVWTVGVV